MDPWRSATAPAKWCFSCQTEGTASERGDCSRRRLRGGSWGSGPEGARAAFRGRFGAASRTNAFGFRVARTD
ncbi:MAG: hypothetical protein FJ184_14475 [Gammaproteobacteria bacterium]|nr:hypothetical protein [Gammaproteobacteria bacterium]